MLNGIVTTLQLIVISLMLVLSRIQDKKITELQNDNKNLKDKLNNDK